MKKLTPPGIGALTLAAALALALPAQANEVTCPDGGNPGSTPDDVFVAGVCTIDGVVTGKAIIVDGGILTVTGSVSAIEASGTAIVNLGDGAIVSADVVHNGSVVPGPAGSINFTGAGAGGATVNGKVELKDPDTDFTVAVASVDNHIFKTLTCNAFSLGGDIVDWDGDGIPDGLIDEAYECFGPPGETGDDSGITAQQFVDACLGLIPEGPFFGLPGDLGFGLVVPSGFELEVVDQFGPPAPYAMGVGNCDVTLSGDAEVEIGKFNRFAIVGDVTIFGDGVEAEFQSKEGVVWVITSSSFTLELLSPEAEAQFEKNTCLWVEDDISITVGVVGPVDDDAELQWKEVTADAYDNPDGALFGTPCDDDDANIFSENGSISLVSLGPDSETQIEKFNIVKAAINITITSENDATAPDGIGDGQTELKEGVRLIANTGLMGGVVDLNGAECILEEGVILSTGVPHMSVTDGFVDPDTLAGCDLVDTD